MSEDLIEDRSSGFIENAEEENFQNKDDEYLHKNSTETDENILFKTDDDIFIRDKKPNEIQIVSYFGFSNDSKFSSIINLISSAIGGGCLNYPLILSNIGLPLTLILFITVILCVYYTLDLLRSFVVDTKYSSFGSITFDILGDTWLKIYNISSLIFYLSIEIIYLSQIYTIISKMIGFPDDKEFIFNIIYFLVSTILEIMIFLFFSKIQKIHLLSLVSCIFFIIVLILVIIQGTTNIINNEEEKKLTYDSLIKPTINNKIEFFFSLMSYIIEFVYGYINHNLYPTVLSNLKNIEQNNTKQIQKISFVIISVFYFLLTFFGFFLRIPMSDILVNYDNIETQGIPIVTAFRIILCLFLFTALPIRFIVIKDNYTSIIKKKNDYTFLQDLLAIFLCLFICNLFVYLTNISIIKFNIVTNFMQLFGGIFGVIISFALPVVNYIGANGKTKVKSIIGYILTGIFSVIGLLSVGYSIYGLFIQNKYDNNDKNK